MNWIKFVENHESEIRLPRIRRSLYSYGKNTEVSQTLSNWYRRNETVL